MMRKRFLIVVASLFFFHSTISFAQEAAKKNLLLDDFEGELMTGLTVDAGAGSGSSVEVSADKTLKHSAEQSLKIVYDAVGGGYIWVARGYGLDVKGAADWSKAPQELDWTKYGAMSFFYLGGAGAAKFAFDVKDAGGEIFRFIFSDDSKEWKQVVCPFDKFLPRGDWQPDSAEKNGVLDFPVKSFQFEPIAVAKGTLYLDEVALEPLN